MSFTAAVTEEIEMSEKAREAKNAYFRAYRGAHKDKLQKYQREYSRKYRKEHPERRKAYEAAYWERRADKDLQQLRDNIAEQAPESEG